MTTNNLKISSYVPQEIYDRFKTFQEEHDLSMSVAGTIILAQFFGIEAEIKASIPNIDKIGVSYKKFQDLQQQLKQLEEKLDFQVLEPRIKELEKAVGIVEELPLSSESKSEPLIKPKGEPLPEPKSEPPINTSGSPLEPKSEPKSEPKGRPPSLVGQAKLNRLYAIAGNHPKLEKAAIVKILEKYGYSSSRDIEPGNYDRIVKDIEYAKEDLLISEMQRQMLINIGFSKGMNFPRLKDFIQELGYKNSRKILKKDFVLVRAKLEGYKLWETWVTSHKAIAWSVNYYQDILNREIEVKIMEKKYNSLPSVEGQTKHQTWYEEILECEE